MSTVISVRPRTHAKNLDSFFSPTGIALVGASNSPEKLGHSMKLALERQRDVPVALINPGSPEMFADVGAAQQEHGGTLDLAIFCIPAVFTAKALREAAKAGIKAALICAGGFAEAGPQGEIFQREIEEVILETGIRVLGPNTSGYFVPPTGLHASFVPGVEKIHQGGVAVLSSSGGVNHSLSFRLGNCGFGVSAGIGVGAGMDVNVPELLRQLADDEATTAIALHLETVVDGEALVEAVKSISPSKPVVAFIVGKSDINDFAQSHTGSLATTWRTMRAALSQAGAVCVENETELVNLAGILSQQRVSPRVSTQIGLITAQAGPGLIAADALGDLGADALPELSLETQQELSKLLPPLTYQKNPVDSGRPSETFPEVVRTVAEDNAIDVLGVYALIEPVVQLADAVAEGTAGHTPTIIGTDGLDHDVDALINTAREYQLPVVSGPTALAKALKGVAQDAKTQYLLKQPAVSAPTVDVPTGKYDEFETKQLLGSLNVSTPRSQRVTNKQEAFEVFERLQAPLVVKLLDADILHKTDIGGVHLNVHTQEQLGAAIDELEESGHTAFLVEEMAPAGIDLIVGAHRDPIFGPMVVFGLGGVDAEATQDFALRTAPIQHQTATSMTDELSAKAVLFNWRGGPTLNTDELEKILASLGNVLINNPKINAIEINPLRLTDRGLVALDAILVWEQE